MVKQGNIDQLQGVFEGLGKVLVGFAGNRIATRVIVSHDQGAGISGQGFFEDFSGVYGGLGDGAPKQLLTLD